MRNRGLKTLIISTALIPSLLIALALGFYLNTSRIHDLNVLLHERGKASASQLATAARQALRSGDHATLQELAALALEERGVRTVSLFNAERRLAAHAGPQMSGLRTADLGADYRVFTLDEEMRFIQPVLPASDFTAASADSADGPLGWVAIEYSRQPYLLQSYHSLLIGGLIITLALVGTIAIAVFASRRLDHGMRILRQGIERIEAGVLDAPVQVQAGGELRILAEDLNRMAAQINNANIELQRNLEQSNRDLRESLETVEVQNIELDLARREALEASRIKSEFLANTSHELRTPLNGIIGFTKLLLKSSLDPRQREYLETIRYSAENLLTIINDILDFSKIEAGKLVLDNVPFNLRDVIEDTLAMLAPSAFEKGLDLLLLYDREVPPELMGDPLRLRQILTNLVSNGIKFTASGHIVVRVSLTAASGARVPLKISVTDTGIGLGAAQQSQLFKAFGQADASTSREFGGTGLGLAISKRLVEQMGGEIGLDSQVGQGSTFWFSLRLQTQGKPLPARQFDRLIGRKLCLYDARPLSQLALRQLLEGWQIEVIALESLDQPIDPGAQPDGWLISLSQEEIARGQLSRLPETAQPVWVLLPGPSADQPALPGVKPLIKPVGHVQLYDALCERLCRHPDSAAPAPVEPTAGSALRVLAVDDNPANLKLLAILLEEQGVAAHLANSGRQALSLCDTQRFDLILLDIQMPELDGIQVARLIRGGAGANRNTRIVALTAHLLPEEQHKLHAAGFNLCLTKPITEQQLLQLLAPAPTGADRSAPASDGGDTRPVDIALCLQRAQQKPDLAREFLHGLLHSLGEARAEIGGALNAGDYAALLEHTHRLHGACCYSGVPHLQKRSRALEDLLKRDGSADAIAAAADAVLSAVDELTEWQEQHDLEILFETTEQEI